MNKNKLNYLGAMGIQSWALRDTPAAEPPSEQGLSIVEEGFMPSEMNWSDLEACVQNCQKCSLHMTRSQTVFGSGDRSATWMLVGEAPGKDEDLQGVPFVGRAGRLLTEMLISIGLARDAVYIANCVKCLPANNRDPLPEESDDCHPYLQRQIELVQPKVLLALGRVAAQNLLNTDRPLRELRGKVHQYGASNIPVVVVYHPADLLRSLSEKRKAWDDLQLAIKVLG